MPRRFFGAGSTPFGCASRPPGRSTSRQRVGRLKVGDEVYSYNWENRAKYGAPVGILNLAG
jgi:hypothetical protein